MQDSVRAARAAGVGVPASGWEKMPSEVWPHVAATITGEWHPGAVKFHLRWWAARERLAGVSRPGRPALAALFGWGDRRLRDFMADPQTWDDTAEPRSRKGPAKVQEGSSVGPDEVQDAIGATVVLEAKGPDEVQARSSLGPDEVQTTSSRALVTETETEPKAEPKRSAPAPAVADLFASLDSHTSADTGKATGEDERAAGVAEPAKPKRSRKAKGDDADPADVDAVIDLWAKTCQRAEKQAARMRVSPVARRQIASVIERDGADVVLTRFAYIAGGGGGQAEWTRKCIADDARPMKIDALLRDPSRQDAKKGGPPWIASVDAEAAEWSENTSGGTVADPRTVAASVWDAMCAHPRWKGMCVPGNAPNGPGDFGNPDRWDLADTADEHDRRMTCFRLSGSIPKWRDADAEGRRQFRERWIELYAKEVTA